MLSDPSVDWWQLETNSTHLSCLSSRELLTDDDLEVYWREEGVSHRPVVRHD